VIRRRLSATIAAAVAAVALSAGASACSSSSSPIPKFTAPVVDQAGVVSDATERQVDSELIDYQARTGNQIAVAIVKTTGSKSLEDYTIDLARAWGVGQKGKDNGAVLLIAYKDRKVRIEVGRGLEGTLTDLDSGRIIRERIIPQMQAGNVDAAIVEGTHGIRQVLQDPALGDLPATEEPAPSPAPSSTGSPWAAVIPIIFLVIFVSGFGRRRRRRGIFGLPNFWGGGWGGGFGGGGFGGGGFGGGGGGGGGGFGGGGGGGFGGGGASGSW
jgi:uncharacterized protein